MSTLKRTNVSLECCDCGSEFVWTIGEQSYYERNKLAPPKRCKPCVKAKREFFGATENAGSAGR